MTPVELFIQIVKDGGAGVVGTSMVDEDIRAFYQQPWVMVASDGGIGLRHPRGAGTFPRVLGRYVREQRLAVAARGDPQDDERAGSQAAAGRSRPNCCRRDRRRRAVQSETIADRSTFTDPALLSRGIEKVFVGGELVWDGGQANRRAARDAC